MASPDVTHNFPPFFKVLKDGKIERYVPTTIVPAGTDPDTGVQSKDVTVDSDTGVTARIFLPKLDNPDQKLPLLVHYHGGGFCIGSALNAVTQNFLSAIAVQARVIAITIDYRLAPETPLPAAYEDSWVGMQWVAGHSDGQGPEPWLNSHVDFGRVFVTGESAGATIAHHVAVRAGATGLAGPNILGLIEVHPFFACNEPDKMIQYFFPGSSGAEDDPYLNAAANPDLPQLKCKNVLVIVAEKDALRPRGLAYYETMSKGGKWSGNVELEESKGEDHCFYLFNHNSENAQALIKRIVDFMAQAQK